jgi:hypothetical protein
MEGWKSEETRVRGGFYLFSGELARFIFILTALLESTSIKQAATPIGVEDHFVFFSRVGQSANHWAIDATPFGVEYK